MSQPISFFSKAQARGRRLDIFASPQKIVQLLEILITKISPKLVIYISLDNIRENNYEILIHILQRGANYLRSGGKSKPSSKNEKIPNTLLLEIVNKMSEILAEESHKRISFRTFTDNYLRILSCPNDIKQFLESGEITLFEALQLKRLSAENLKISQEKAFKLRADFFLNCRKEKWIIQRLRYEIDLKLNKFDLVENSIKNPSPPIEETDLSFDRELSINPNSFFNEQICSMMEMISSIDVKELEKTELDMLLNSVDNVILQLQKIIKKQQKTIKKTKIENPNLGFL
ncbi:MAG: hypothetical protein HY819_05005 [Acidobacteria bacterium]|nr:hypothetical protein [Acidobacteriota bacterium]